MSFFIPKTGEQANLKVGVPSLLNPTIRPISQKRIAPSHKEESLTPRLHPKI
jgi:hypothetical protein